jgi:predicted aspartyl protease
MIVIERVALVEEKINNIEEDFFVINYRQYKLEEGMIGQNCLKMEYRVCV